MKYAYMKYAYCLSLRPGTEIKPLNLFAVGLLHDHSVVQSPSGPGSPEKSDQAHSEIGRVFNGSDLT